MKNNQIFLNKLIEHFLYAFQGEFAMSKKLQKKALRMYFEPILQKIIDFYGEDDIAKIVANAKLPDWFGCDLQNDFEEYGAPSDLFEFLEKQQDIFAQEAADTQGWPIALVGRTGRIYKTFNSKY